ncbi:MAG: hypothetical protein EXX96DRAFT_592235 [Benjaminiella poitrasii]|nr:MAG: hypothetical protein EXX96DRAFT_592235 [Benjaminiella poitrasii]
MDRLNVKFKEDCCDHLRTKKRDSPITMKDMLESLKKEIVDDYKVGDDIVQTEREWRLRIAEVAKAMDIKLKRHSPEHKNIVRKLIDQQSKTVVEIYEQMDEERMWKLSSGKIVEKEMMKMVERCKFEHPCHSFIFDTEDKNWLDFFTLEEINLPENFSNLLDNIHQSVNVIGMNDLHKCLSTKYFHPKNEAPCHWAQKSVLEGIELHMFDFLKDTEYTERDLMSRIWRLILTSFNHSRITIREEVPSAATKAQMNRKRRLSTLEPMKRKLKSKVPDHIMKFGTYEIGLTEGAKLDDDETGNKFLKDVMFKTPKLLKDMMSKLNEVAPHKKNSLRAVGLVTSRK